VEKLVASVMFSVLVLGLMILGLAQPPTSVADTDLPDDEVTAVSAEAGSPSVSTGIAISMYAIDDESEPQTDSASVTLRARTAADD